jgi:hypothetical protein
MRSGLVLGLLALAGCVGGLDQVCDADALNEALASASGFVRIGTCTIEGSFVVPSGIAVPGENSEASTLIGVAGTPGQAVGL